MRYKMAPENYMQKLAKALKNTIYTIPLALAVTGCGATLHNTRTSNLGYVRGPLSSAQIQTLENSVEGAAVVPIAEAVQLPNGKASQANVNGSENYDFNQTVQKYFEDYRKTLKTGIELVNGNGTNPGELDRNFIPQADMEFYALTGDRTELNFGNGNGSGNVNYDFEIPKSPFITAILPGLTNFGGYMDNDYPEAAAFVPDVDAYKNTTIPVVINYGSQPGNMTILVSGKESLEGNNVYKIRINFAPQTANKIIESVKKDAASMQNSQTLPESGLESKLERESAFSEREYGEYKKTNANLRDFADFFKMPVLGAEAGAIISGLEGARAGAIGMLAYAATGTMINAFTTSSDQAENSRLIIGLMDRYGEDLSQVQKRVLAFRDAVAEGYNDGSDLSFILFPYQTNSDIKSNGNSNLNDGLAIIQVGSNVESVKRVDDSTIEITAISDGDNWYAQLLKDAATTAAGAYLVRRAFEGYEWDKDHKGKKEKIGNEQQEPSQPTPEPSQPPIGGGINSSDGITSPHNNP